MIMVGFRFRGGEMQQFLPHRLDGHSKWSFAMNHSDQCGFTFPRNIPSQHSAMPVQNVLYARMHN